MEIPVVAPAWFGGTKPFSGVPLRINKTQTTFFSHKEEAVIFFSPLALKVTENCRDSQAVP